MCSIAQYKQNRLLQWNRGRCPPSRNFRPRALQVRKGQHPETTWAFAEFICLRTVALFIFLLYWLIYMLFEFPTGDQLDLANYLTYRPCVFFFATPTLALQLCKGQRDLPAAVGYVRRVYAMYVRVVRKQPRHRASIRRRGPPMCRPFSRCRKALRCRPCHEINAV